ncbi:TPA_asm: UL6.4 sORF 1 [Human alphaherpesvirus 1]|nr:TPA_asm: UL6.4 sORF 1 [Human alphaherpesvirus 1]
MGSRTSQSPRRWL